MAYAKEITGTFCGVEIPSWLRVFDCRSDDPFVHKTPDGRTLWGSERAAWDMGLRRPGSYDHDDTSPLSCSTYIDARTCDESEIARQLRDGIQAASKFRDEWQAAKALPHKPGSGGSCLYKPVAFCLSNFGWGIMSDARTMVVRSFDS